MESKGRTISKELKIIRPWPNLIYDPDIQARVDFFGGRGVPISRFRNPVIVLQKGPRSFPSTFVQIYLYLLCHPRNVASFMLRAL